MFRERIAERIAALETNPSAVSARAGHGRTLVTEILNGKSRDPGIVKLSDVARALETSLAYLIGETDDPIPSAPLRSLRAVRDAEVVDLDLVQSPDTGKAVLGLKDAEKTTRYLLTANQLMALKHLVGESLRDMKLTASQ